ncbi:MAG: nitroreductase family protein [Halanaerobiales bacterium]|nr:nitroreductase family protein [Halanaerobiales bacterium]
MEGIKLLKSRRSIRELKDQEVEKDKLEKVVETARYAPTANNVQPWQFVVVTEDDKIKRLEELTDQDKKFPAAIAVFSEDVKHHLEDGSNVTTYILLAAKELGLGTCWIGSYGKPYTSEVKDMLDVPQEYKLISIVTVGYPDENPHPNKKELDEVIHWEKY